MFLAERYHLADAANGQPGFDRPRLIVKSAMQDSAVIPRLVAADRILLLEDGDAAARRGLAEPESRCQPHDAAADNDHVSGHDPMLGLNANSNPNLTSGHKGILSKVLPKNPFTACMGSVKV